MTLEPTFGRSAQGPVRVTHPYVTASGRASGLRSSALLAGARQNSQSAGGTGRALLRSKPSGRHVEPAADGATLNPGGEGMCCRAQVRSHIREIASRHEKVERALLGVCGKSPLPQPGEDPPPENTKGRHVPERSRRQRE